MLRASNYQQNNSKPSKYQESVLHNWCKLTPCDDNVQCLFMLLTWWDCLLSKPVQVHTHTHRYTYISTTSFIILKRFFIVKTYPSTHDHTHRYTYISTASYFSLKRLFIVQMSPDVQLQRTPLTKMWHILRAMIQQQKCDVSCAQ